MNRSRLLKDKRRGKGPLRSPFVLTFAAVPAAAVIAATACGQSKPATNSLTSPPPPDTNNGDGPCSPEGSSRSCHVTLGQTQGILNCFEGTQACVGGMWSACGGSGTVSGHNLRAGGLAPAQIGSGGGGSLHTDSLSDASAEAAVCTVNPCDPYCMGFEEDAGPLTPEGGAGSVGDVPLNKDLHKKVRDALFQDNCYAFDNNCDIYPSTTAPPSAANSTLFACQADSFCSLATTGGDGCCHQFDSMQTYPSAPLVPMPGTNAGVDMTIGVPCYTTTAGTYDSVPICNRGTTALAAGGNITVEVMPTGSELPTTTCPAAYPTPTCSMANPGLAAGTCTLMPFSACSGGVPSSDSFLYVNADFSITEQTFTPDPALGENIQGGCADNWSAFGPGNNPPSCGVVSAAGPLVYTQDYYADCSATPATRAKWGLLTYDSSTPSSMADGNTDIKFEIETAASLPDGAVGTDTSFVTVADASQAGDPPVCNLAGPAIDPTCTSGNMGPTPPCCPIDLSAALINGLSPNGVVATTNQNLTLRITLTPSPDGVLKPTLYSWEITYSCVPSE
jgi:hypothetical protein